MDTITNTPEKKPDVIRLKNGVKIWYIPNRKSKLLNIGFWTLGGYSMETKATLEYYHFLEHMLADFTSSKYPNGLQNNKILKTLGVDLQGEVENNTMHIWLEGHARAADVMLDMVTHGILDYQLDLERFKQEQEAIITELQGYQNDPFLTLEEYRERKLYPRHSVSATLEERIRNIKKSTPKSLSKFYKESVIPERIIVYVSGYLPNAKENLRHLKRSLSKLPKRKPLLTLTQLRNYRPSESFKPNVYTVKLSGNHTQRVDFVWKTGHMNEFHRDYEVFDALEMLFKMKLFDILRIDKGLIYSVKIKPRYDNTNEHLSYFAIELEVNSRKNIKPTIEATLGFVSDLNAITENDLLQCKREETNRYEGMLLDRNQLDYAWDYVPAILMNEYIPYSKMMHNKFQDITLKNIKHTIRTHLAVEKAYVFIGVSK